jgi:hypothetical protein
VTASGTECEAIVYHYCDFRDLHSNSEEAVLRTLLASLLISGGATLDWMEQLPELETLKLAPGGSAGSDSIDKLTKLISKAAGVYNKTTIVLDALDECAEFGALATWLVRICEDFSTSVRVFVSSRREQGIVEILDALPHISLNEEAEHVSSDTGTHVRAEMAKQAKLSRLPSPLRAEIIDELVKRADGM